jgi:hypothetical protein
MAKSHLRVIPPRSENRTVTPRRLPYADIRPREHLTEREVMKLIEAAKGNRRGSVTRPCCSCASAMASEPASFANCGGPTWNLKPERCTCAGRKAARPERIR